LSASEEKDHEQSPYVWIHLYDTPLDCIVRVLVFFILSHEFVGGLHAVHR